MKWKRFTSPVFLAALFTNVFYLLKLTGALECVNITQESYFEITTALTTIINIIAAANNPVDRENF